MCGIVGYIGNHDAKTAILDGLKRLEYRGYDSSGLALIYGNKLIMGKKSGKIRELEKLLQSITLKSGLGIGHTRWATHGAPTDENAHPHTDCSNTIAVVHNGIIENHMELKEYLENKGHKFSSETDTEVIAHLVEEEIQHTNSLTKAVKEAVNKLKGSFAICIIALKDPDKILCARKDSPLVIGIGQNEYFVASDIPAFLNYTNKVIFLEDGDIAEISKKGIKIISFKGKELKREIKKIDWSISQAEKAGYKHFMLKEIYEQPRAVADTLSGRILMLRKNLFLEELNNATFDRIQIVACGTSYHAGLIGKFYFENFAGIPTEVDYASEYRYRSPSTNEKTLVIAITQSGETADTIAAIRLAKSKKATVIAICNVMGATATREANHTIYTYAGPEISVASTKAFTTQLATLLMMSIKFALLKQKLTLKSAEHLINELASVPSIMEEILNTEKKTGTIKEIAYKIHTARNALYLGRHVNFPIALEGALKLKEISYIHAEGYPAGEMKHGPIALIDENMPVIVISTKGSVYQKIVSNIQEVVARKGMVLALINYGDSEVKKLTNMTIEVPPVNEFISPFINIIPLQLLAYFIADYLGYDVDQPRNLAKSVTVE